MSRAQRLAQAINRCQELAMDGRVIPHGAISAVAREFGVDDSVLSRNLLDRGYMGERLAQQLHRQGVGLYSEGCTWGWQPLTPKDELALIERAMARVRGAA